MSDTLQIRSTEYEIALKRDYGIEAKVYLSQNGYTILHNNNIHDLTCSISSQSPYAPYLKTMASFCGWNSED